jgi:hypothetical protein
MKSTLSASLAARVTFEWGLVVKSNTPAETNALGGYLLAIYCFLR